MLNNLLNTIPMMCRECEAIKLMPDYRKPSVCPLCGKKVKGNHTLSSHNRRAGCENFASELKMEGVYESSNILKIQKEG